MTTPDGAAALVLARLQTLTAFGHFDGAVPIGIAAESPHTIYYPSAATPMARKASGKAKSLLGFGSVVCVNNNPAGAVKLAALVVDLLDGWQMTDGSLVRCSTGPAIRDPDMKAGYCWSATVQISYYLTR